MGPVIELNRVLLPDGEVLVALTATVSLRLQT